MYGDLYWGVVVVEWAFAAHGRASAAHEWTAWSRCGELWEGEVAVILLLAGLHAEPYAVLNAREEAAVEELQILLRVTTARYLVQVVVAGRRIEVQCSLRLRAAS